MSDLPVIRIEITDPDKVFGGDFVLKGEVVQFSYETHDVGRAVELNLLINSVGMEDDEHKKSS